MTPARLEAALKRGRAPTGQARRRALRSWEGCTGSTGSCCGGSGASTPSAARRRRWTRCGASRRCGVGRRCCSTASTTSARLQLDAIETLGAVVDARVTVSLAYEPGTGGVRGARGHVPDAAAAGGEHRRLEARAEYYAPGARAALHHLERSLFEPGAGRSGRGRGGAAAGGRGRARGAGAGGGRGEGAAGRGMAAEEIAVVHRTPSAVAELLGEVFAARGIPYALERRVGFANTAIGRSAGRGAAQHDGRGRGRQTCWPGCERRVCWRAPSWPTGWRRRRGARG